MALAPQRPDGLYVILPGQTLDIPARTLTIIDGAGWGIKSLYSTPSAELIYDIAEVINFNDGAHFNNPNGYNVVPGDGGTLRITTPGPDATHLLPGQPFFPSEGIFNGGDPGPRGALQAAYQSDTIGLLSEKWCYPLGLRMAVVLDTCLINGQSINPYRITASPTNLIIDVTCGDVVTFTYSNSLFNFGTAGRVTFTGTRTDASGSTSIPATSNQDSSVSQYTFTACETTVFLIRATTDFLVTDLLDGYVNTDASCTLTVNVNPLPPSILNARPLYNRYVAYPISGTSDTSFENELFFVVKNASAARLVDTQGVTLATIGLNGDPSSPQGCTATSITLGVNVRGGGANNGRLTIQALTSSDKPLTPSTYIGQWPLLADGLTLDPSYGFTVVADRGCCGEAVQALGGQIGSSAPPRTSASGVAFALDAHRRPAFADVRGPSSSAGSSFTELHLKTTKDAGHTYDDHLCLTAPASAADPSLLIDPYLNVFRLLYFDGTQIVTSLAQINGERGDWGTPFPLSALPTGAAAISGASPVCAPHPYQRRAAALCYLSGGSLKTANSHDGGKTWTANAAAVDTGLDFSASGRAALCFLQEILFVAYAKAGALVCRTSPDRGGSWGAVNTVASSASGALSALAQGGRLHVLDGGASRLYSSGDLGGHWSSATAPAVSDPVIGSLPYTRRLLDGTTRASDSSGAGWFAT